MCHHFASITKKILFNDYDPILKCFQTNYVILLITWFILFNLIFTFLFVD